MNQTYTLTLLYSAEQLRMEKHKKHMSKVKEISLERDYWLDCLEDAELRLPLRDQTVKLLTKITNKTKKTLSNDNILSFNIVRSC